MNLTKEKFIAFLTAFGIPMYADGGIVCGGEHGQVDISTLRLIEFHKLCTTHERWIAFIKKYELDKNNIRLRKFARDNKPTFDTRVNSVVREYYEKFDPSDKELAEYLTKISQNGSGSLTPLGGEIYDVAIASHYKFYQLVNTGIHCYCGESVMDMAEGGDETAIHWLEMCNYVCYRRGLR